MHKHFYKKVLPTLLALTMVIVFPLAASADFWPSGPWTRIYPIGVAQNNDDVFNVITAVAPGIVMSGNPLPQGLTYTGTMYNTYINGIPAPGTVGVYTLHATTPNDGHTGTCTLQIAAGPQVIDLVANQNIKMGDAPTVLLQIKNGAGNVIPPLSTDAPTLIIANSNPAVATINSTTGLITPVALGTTTITMDSAATPSYNAAAGVYFTVTVAKATPSVSGAETPTGVVGSVGAKTVNATLSNSYSEAITLTASVGGKTATATQTGDGTVAFNFIAADLDSLAVGSYPITVSSVATANNEAISATTVGTLVVSAPATGGGGTQPTPTPKPVQYVTQPAGASNNYTIGVNKSYRNFQGVSVDGRRLSSSDYTSWEGSTYVRLNQSFLDTLSNGMHTMTLHFTDGDVSSSFEVSGRSSDIIGIAVYPYGQEPAPYTSSVTPASTIVKETVDEGTEEQTINETDVASQSDAAQSNDGNARAPEQGTQIAPKTGDSATNILQAMIATIIVFLGTLAFIIRKRVR